MWILVGTNFFLGHVISRARIFVFFLWFFFPFFFLFFSFFLRMVRISVDPKKIEAIVNWERPETVTKIHNFLGLASYLAEEKSWLEIQLYERENNFIIYKLSIMISIYHKKKKTKKQKKQNKTKFKDKFWSQTWL